MYDRPAQNLLSLKLAASLGIVIASPWLTWFKASCVPALVGLLVTPLLVFKMFPPEIQDTPEAPVEAAEKLRKLGPLSQDETMVCATMGLTVILWIFGDKIGMSSVVAAMLGMSLQLVTGVITWQDCLNEKGAWDTLLWFAVLIGMSSQLNQMGFISFLSDSVAAALAKLSMGWQQVFVLLHACYFFIHYLFASQTAQVAALSTAFMAMMIASGAPPMLAGLTVAFHHEPLRRHHALRQRTGRRLLRRGIRRSPHHLQARRRPRRREPPHLGHHRRHVVEDHRTVLIAEDSYRANRPGIGESTRNHARRV